MGQDAGTCDRPDDCKCVCFRGRNGLCDRQRCCSRLLGQHSDSRSHAGNRLIRGKCGAKRSVRFRRIQRVRDKNQRCRYDVDLFDISRRIGWRSGGRDGSRFERFGLDNGQHEFGRFPDAECGAVAKRRKRRRVCGTAEFDRRTAVFHISWRQRVRCGRRDRNRWFGQWIRHRFRVFRISHDSGRPEVHLGIAECVCRQIQPDRGVAVFDPARRQRHRLRRGNRGGYVRNGLRDGIGQFRDLHRRSRRRRAGNIWRFGRRVCCPAQPHGDGAFVLHVSRRRKRRFRGHDRSGYGRKCIHRRYHKLVRSCDCRRCADNLRWRTERVRGQTERSRECVQLHFVSWRQSRERRFRPGHRRLGQCLRGGLDEFGQLSDRGSGAESERDHNFFVSEPGLRGHLVRLRFEPPGRRVPDIVQPVGEFGRGPHQRRYLPDDERRDFVDTAKLPDALVYRPQSGDRNDDLRSDAERFCLPFHGRRRNVDADGQRSLAARFGARGRPIDREYGLRLLRQLFQFGCEFNVSVDGRRRDLDVGGRKHLDHGCEFRGRYDRWRGVCGCQRRRHLQEHESGNSLDSGFGAGSVPATFRISGCRDHGLLCGLLRDVQVDRWRQHVADAFGSDRSRVRGSGPGESVGSLCFQREIRSGSAFSRRRRNVERTNLDARTGELGPIRAACG